MDAIVKLVEMNSRNPWSQITSEKMFLSFLQGANVHNCAGFFVKSSSEDDDLCYEENNNRIAEQRADIVLTHRGDETERRFRCRR